VRPVIYSIVYVFLQHIFAIYVAFLALIAPHQPFYRQK